MFRISLKPAREGDTEFVQLFISDWTFLLNAAKVKAVNSWVEQGNTMVEKFRAANLRDRVQKDRLTKQEQRLAKQAGRLAYLEARLSEHRTKTAQLANRIKRVEAESRAVSERCVETVQTQGDELRKVRKEKRNLVASQASLRLRLKLRQQDSAEATRRFDRDQESLNFLRDKVAHMTAVIDGLEGVIQNRDIQLHMSRDEAKRTAGSRESWMGVARTWEAEHKQVSDELDSAKIRSKNMSNRNDIQCDMIRKAVEALEDSKLCGWARGENAIAILTGRRV